LIKPQASSLKPFSVLAELRVVKTCPACGREYTRSGWEDLPLVGTQQFPGDPALELRNCYCRSTIAMEKSE